MTDQNEIGRALVKSFIAVAGGVLIATIGYMLVMGLIIVLFYPAYAKQMAGEGNIQTDMAGGEKENPVEAAPKLELPDSFFAICPFAQALAAWLGGYLASRFAPAGRMGHGTLVAGVLLFHSIQLLLQEDPPLPGWLISINTVVGPACALWGAATADKFAAAGRINLPDSDSDSDSREEVRPS